jgi:hypothetical protein
MKKNPLHHALCNHSITPFCGMAPLHENLALLTTCSFYKYQEGESLKVKEKQNPNQDW